MKPAPNGYVPASGFLEQQFDRLKGHGIPPFELLELDKLLDSANMQPDDWVKIAHIIANCYDKFSGFVVVHGTDTMAYTASTLAFLLDGLDKPIILTGSQVPLYQDTGEGIENIINSLQFAARFPVPEVCICFGGKLLRGCRAVKVSAGRADAFQSPNYPLLGRAMPEPAVNWEHIRSAPTPTPRSTLRVSNQRLAHIGVLRLFPGITSRFVERSLDEPWDGLILQTYGAGSAPSNEFDMMQVLEKAIAAGLVIVSVSQCLKGSVQINRYASSSILWEMGILSGGDMTTESAMAKLFYLCGNNLSHRELSAAVYCNLRGELTEHS